ncbi:unnamed protein product, partial [Sphagnum troendelagicum]
MEEEGTAQENEGARTASSAVAPASGATLECGAMEQVGKFLGFLGLCFVLFVIGIVKGTIVGPPSVLIMFAGHMAVVIGLWPVHVTCTYRTLALTKKLGIVLKVLSLVLLPIPLLLWPPAVAIGSLLVGVGYGFGQPLVATFEAVGESRDAKLFHSLTDGTYSTLKGSCTVVRDFTDFTFHSYFDLIDEFRTGEPKGGKPLDVKLADIPGCIFVGLLGMVVDMLLISSVALAKSPLMLLKGWKQLTMDLLGQQGSCADAACVPLAGLAILLWPLVVCATVFTAMICSPFFGLFSAVIVYQESSLFFGLSHIVAVVAEFDEYSNDFLDLNEGSCLPRPRYRRNMVESNRSGVASKPDVESGTKETATQESLTQIPQLTPQRSLKQTLQEVKLVQLWDHSFKNLENGGKVLIDAGVLRLCDLEAFIKNSRNPKIKWVAVGLNSYSTLKHLLASAKSGTVGLLLRDGTEVTSFNQPKERVAQWFFDPLLTIRNQLRAAHLQESEEHYLEKLVLIVGNEERINAWDNGAVEPDDGMRRGELQALARRLQGITTSIARLPTHRRRFEALIKSLLPYAQERSNKIQPMSPNIHI